MHTYVYTGEPTSTIDPASRRFGTGGRPQVHYRRHSGVMSIGTGGAGTVSALISIEGITTAFRRHKVLAPVVFVPVVLTPLVRF